MGAWLEDCGAQACEVISKCLLAGEGKGGRRVLTAGLKHCVATVVGLTRAEQRVA